MITLENIKGKRKEIYEEELSRIYIPEEGERFIVAKSYTLSNFEYQSPKSAGYVYIASSLGALFEIRRDEIVIVQEYDNTNLIVMNGINGDFFNSTALIVLPRTRLIYNAFHPDDSLAGKDVIKVDENGDSRLTNLKTIDREDKAYLIKRPNAIEASRNGIECFNLDGSYRCSYRSVTEFANEIGRYRKNAIRRVYGDKFYKKVKDLGFIANAVPWKLS